MDKDKVDELDPISVSEYAICEVEQTKLMLHDQPKSLIILNQNIRSINKKFDDFTVLMKRLEVDCDIITLTESWLGSDPFLPIINGYRSHATTKRALQNDGIVVYVKSDIKITFKEPTFPEGNCLIMILGLETAIIAIYRSPSYRNLDSFNMYLNCILSNLSTFKNIYNIDDLNIDIRLNLCASHGLLPAHSSPTRQNKTCLDHVLLKTKKAALTLVITSTLTDHQTVLLCLNQNEIKKSSLKHTTKLNNEALLTDIVNIDFELIYRSYDANFCIQFLVTTLKTVIEQNTVIIQTSRRLKTLNLGLPLA
ncbi:unnamed protein product [Parnassius mnemosyne]|uniref:Uncharacterized protein n=1 Tax=Parnassius mnemosyne TaxID=213953 RepID=A0AAV1MCQ3_9NEOP